MLEDDIYDAGIEIPSGLLPSISTHATSYQTASTTMDDAMPVPSYNIGSSGTIDIDIVADPNDIAAAAVDQSEPTIFVADFSSSSTQRETTMINQQHQPQPPDASILFPAAPVDDLFVVPQESLYPSIPSTNPLVQPQRYYA